MRTGRIIASRYRLEQPLASGGMGTVWIAEHTQLGIQVAVKFMDPELTAEPDLRSRFEREAKSAAALQSPHVIQIHDYGMDADTPFIAMELLRGEDLEVRLDHAGGKLPLDEVIKIVIQTCKALRAAHDAGIVHRDLKPSNIFLTKDGDDELVKVLDFGIAKEMGLGITSKHDTSARELLGSPAYISPEQIRRARAVDHRTDLWSLAVIAFEAITGSLPFDSEDAGDLLARILTETAEKPSALAPGLPETLDLFFARALERDLDARFQSAREFSRELVAACGGRRSIADLSQPGLVVPPPTPSDSGRYALPHRVQATTLVLADADTLDGDEPRPGRKAPPEAFLTDAPRSVDIQPTTTSSSKGRWLWLAVALLGAGLGAFAVFGREAATGDGAPAAMSEPAAAASASITTLPSPPPPPSVAEVAPAVSIADPPPVAAPSASASAEPAVAAPRRIGAPVAPPTKPKSPVLGF